MFLDVPVLSDIDNSASFSMSMSGAIVDTKDSSDIEDPRFFAIWEILYTWTTQTLILKYKTDEQIQVKSDESKWMILS